MEIFEQLEQLENRKRTIRTVREQIDYLICFRLLYLRIWAARPSRDTASSQFTWGTPGHVNQLENVIERLNTFQPIRKGKWGLEYFPTNQKR